MTSTVRVHVRRFLSIFRRAFTQWRADQALRMGAALAFYTAFSLAPLLILIISTGSIFFDRHVAESQIINEIASMIGRDGAEALKTMIDAAHRSSQGLTASILGMVALLIGSAGALIELQDGLDRIWKVHETRGLMVLVRQRLLAFPIVFGIAFLLLVSLVVSAALSALGVVFHAQGSTHTFLWHSLDLLFSWGVITWLFAMIYKILLDVFVSWEEVSVGGAVAALLFTLGKFLVGLYIGKSTIATAYGAAGSFVVILLWVYYSALILYFGAEFSKAYRDQSPERSSVRRKKAS